MLDISIGAINFFSLLYNPGDIKAQKLYTDIGKVIATDKSRINLKGARNGEATSTAIILDPSGKTFKRGDAKKLYIELAKGVNKIAQKMIAEIIISNLFLSSNK